eukprot:CAMPEP_0206305272 /NCGR_PEP_ID=MMETSP0106_2-20121207/10178_1 /ASSEMBLY_ACC=CAM_ASM_000206 /TAXON_ID=81532 /ORGANISM="Acanthoeca-like sp., Strain 10tr" /LENGTH=322 /DNA_ID=CAMNT_0053736115 /DNA_START=59 /DNA_END=1027 /DNA_ORIENTATION=-
MPPAVTSTPSGAKGGAAPVTPTTKPTSREGTPKKKKPSAKKSSTKSKKGEVGREITAAYVATALREDEGEGEGKGKGKGKGKGRAKGADEEVIQLGEPEALNAASEEDGSAAVIADLDATPAGSARKKISKQSLSEFNEKERRRGIIYMSRIPPFMKPMKVRHLMEHHGAVGRLYLRPEEARIAAKRKKFGGSRKTNYVEGWVEFEDKRVARRVAQDLNGTNVGGKKGNFHYDDHWSMLYLPKFKWHHLTERIAYDNAVRQKRLQAEDAQVRRETQAYIEQVSKAKRNEMLDRKGIKRPGESESSQPPTRRIKMRKPIASAE